MPTLAEIDAEIARRQAQQSAEPSLADIDAEIARRQQPPTEQEVTDSKIEDSSYPGQQYIEPAMTMASGMVAEPAAGIAGLVSAPFEGMEGAADIVESVREAMTYVPSDSKALGNLQKIADFFEPATDAITAVEEGSGDIGYDIAGPIGGAIGKTAPTAAMELMGLGAVKRGIKSGKKADVVAGVARKQRDAENLEDIARVKEGIISPDIKTETPEPQQYEELLNNIKKGKTQESAIEVMPDEDILQSAKDLNIDLNPDHYSSNRVFQEVTQSLKSRPGSTLGASEAKAIQQLGDNADKLISDLGGQTDKTLLDMNVRNDIEGTISKLESKSNESYQRINEVIPRAVQVEPTNSRNYITSVLDDLGGDKTQLAPSEKKLLSIMDKNPTYAALDRLRKDVGNGFKKAGPFKDDDTGTLKQVYKSLSEDQQMTADAFGVGDEYLLAKKLVSDRKGVEDEAIKLFGKNLQDSVIPKLRTASTSLTKGDLSKFKKLMSAVPKGRRAEVSASMLNDLFTQGARTGMPLGGGFVKAWHGLNRNKGAKDILFENLPKEARTRFDKIGRVANGIYRSKALENTSKTARDLISAMDDGGMFGKILQGGGKAYAADLATSAMGAPGVGAAASIVSDISKRGRTATQKADAFISSGAFKKAIEETARSGDPKRADKILKNSKEYKEWIASMTKENRAKLALQGFIPYITDRNDDEQPQEQNQ